MILTVSTTTLDAALLKAGYDMGLWSRYDRWTKDDWRCAMSKKRFPISAIQLDVTATRQAMCDAIFDWGRSPSRFGKDYQHWAMTFPNEDDAVWWHLKYA